MYIIDIATNIPTTPWYEKFASSRKIPDKIKYFFGNVHEELRLKEESLTIIQLNFEIVHYGYAANIMKSKNKIKRNLSLLEKVREIEPDNLRWIYFFIRDGKDVIDYETVTNLVNKYIKKDIGSERFEDNVVDNKYTYAILNEFVFTSSNSNLFKSINIFVDKSIPIGNVLF